VIYLITGKGYSCICFTLGIDYVAPTSPSLRNNLLFLSAVILYLDSASVVLGIRKKHIVYSAEKQKAPNGYKWQL